MKKINTYLITPVVMIFLLIISSSVQAQGISGETIANLTDVQKYYRAIHIILEKQFIQNPYNFFIPLSFL